MKEIKQRINEIGSRLLDGGGVVTPTEIKNVLMSEDKGLLKAYGEVLIGKSILGFAKTYLSGTNAPVKNSPITQHYLPGLIPPLTVTFPTDHNGGFGYIRMDMATKWHLDEYFQILNKNITDAVEKKEDFKEKLDYLEPAFEHNQNFTVGEACQWLVGREEGRAA